MPTMLHNINSQQMPRAVENHIKAINQVFCTHLQKSGRNREKEGKKEIHFEDRNMRAARQSKRKAKAE